ncbi:Mitochondrial import inner membrane translocase subunit TIM50-B [Echinococcus granulosus]|nr:Mitochondrial import inner membrane translocase subunit TIM50-B [Echinococcus granulosus]
MSSRMSVLSPLFIQRLHFFTVPNFKALRFVNGRFLSAVASDFQPSSNKNEENSESKSNKESGSWSGKNAWKLGALSIAASAAFAAGCGIAVWGPPGRDENDVEIKDEFSDLPRWRGYVCRAWQTMWDFNQSIRDPISEKLLPDPVEPPYYQPPYTIVLEINDVLVHPDWKIRLAFQKKTCFGTVFTATFSFL